MKNQWTNFFFGSVKVKVFGKGIERFLNDCIRNEILIWQVQKHDHDTATFYMKYTDIKKIRPIIRKYPCKLKFLDKNGAPFILKKSLLNFGFVLGLVFCVLLITLFSNMVWKIEIEGAKPVTEHLIRKELKKLGVERGKLQFHIDDAETIQRHLTNNVKAITWVGVEVKGTTYHFRVVEKNQPKPPEMLSPRHLVAKKKAVITYMFVEKGQPLVAVHDHVLKGQILVSGIIGQENKTEIVPAKGKVFGETWYKSEVTVPLKTTFHIFTGEYYNKHYITFWDFPILIWGYKNPEYKNIEKETNVKHIKFLKWTLPIAYVKSTLREKEIETRIYTVEEAFNVAKQMGRKEMESKIEEEGKIKDEKVLRQKKENGKVKLVILYKVIENIVTPQPIIQGD
jgi:similar to stage IV sporulation protein